MKLFPYLTSIAIEPTNDCNMDCGYCYRKNREVGYMDFAVFKRIVDHLPFYLRVGLSYGGESILHPQFNEMVAYCRKKHFRDLNVYSNGIVNYPSGIRVVVNPKPPKSIISLNQCWIKPPKPLMSLYKSCGQLSRYMAILWNGDVVPCCSDVGGVRVIGNVGDGSDLWRVWHSHEYSDLRKLGHCSQCEIYSYLR